MAVTWKKLAYSDDPPATHASVHENAGSDEINVAGLNGELADDQPPKSHDLDSTLHTATGNVGNYINISGASLVQYRTPAQVLSDIGAAALVHVSRHENGGADEINLTGLSGELADGQTPLLHNFDTHAVDVGDQGNYIRVDSGNAILEWRTPANVRSDIDAAATSHNHATGDVTSGVFNVARIPDFDALAVAAGDQGKYIKVQDASPGLEWLSKAELAATLALDDIGVPDAAVDFDLQEATDLVFMTVANVAALPTTGIAEGQVCFADSEKSLHICTAIA